MILEVATLLIKNKQNKAFEAAFKQAEVILSSMKGYCTHSLQKCLEKDNQYILLVTWETLEDHNIGFRKSPEYKQWSQLLHHFYDPFPEVNHYSTEY